MITPLMFYLFATVLVVSALGVTFAKNPVHAVLFLIMAFFNAGALFLMLGAEFVAMSLLIVYVGAVAVLFLFVVMMLDISKAFSRFSGKGYWLSALFVGFLLMAEMGFVFSKWQVDDAALGNVAIAQQPLESVSNTHSIGKYLYTDYVWMFEISGFILFVAMIAAITLTQRKRAGIRRQDIIEQVSRKRADVVKLASPKSGEGVI